MSPRTAAVSLAILFAIPVAAATRITYDVNGKPTPIEWQASAFPLQYEIDSKLVAAKPAIGTMVDRAFETWAAVPDANVTFSSRGVTTTAAKRNDGRINVSIADELFRGQGALALTTYTFDENGRSGWNWSRTCAHRRSRR